MGDIQELRVTKVPTMSEDHIARVKGVEGYLRQQEQVAVTTTHSIHAGVYARTILIPAGVTITGALIKRSTNLVVSGHVIVTIGEREACEYEGYAVLQGSANRKQVFVAIEDTYLTMFFATQADEIEEAEAEFTEEGELLISRQPGSVNHITITGE